MTIKKGQSNVLSTPNHSTVINEAGVVFVESPDDRGLCVRVEPQDAIAHAEFVLEHRAELELLQQELEATWKTVASEVRTYMEEQEPGSFAEASEFGIRDALEAMVELRRGQAASWYPTLFENGDFENGEHTTFEQHWGPFLCRCRELQAQDEGETDQYDDRTVPRDF